MSAYQKMIELQDEVERLTGVRPFVRLGFHSHTDGLDETKAADIRNTLIADSNGRLESSEYALEDHTSEWTCYRGEDDRGRFEVTVHGPHNRYANAEAEAHGVPVAQPAV